MSKLFTILIFLVFCAGFNQPAHANVCYVTDAGGCAYDDCRTSVNFAPAVAATTVIVVAIIALAVQNSHHHHSHNSSSRSSSNSSSHQ
jgi:hypothetical protein